jgi:predicted alpha/beta-hydrolase family hydrolase
LDQTVTSTIVKGNPMYRIDGQPAKGRIIFAHGAGAPMDSGFMQSVALGLAVTGFEVVRFEFGYMQARRDDGRRPPSRMPQLLDEFARQVELFDDGQPLWLAGKSMGGRVATMLLEQTRAQGALVFGYPFHPQRQPERLRIEHLAGLSRPVHIFQGTRDALGSRLEVESYALSPEVYLHWLEDGDHDLKPRKASGLTQAQHLHSVFARVASL